MSALVTYVLDTSVLLSDPRAMLRFAEHEVVIPLVVVSELEGKRHHPELGYTARRALAILDEMREEHGRLDRPFQVGQDGGSLRVEINHVDTTQLPRTFDRAENDTRILAVARNLQAEGSTVVVVTKDVPMRVKAAVAGSRRPSSTSTSRPEIRASPACRRWASTRRRCRPCSTRAGCRPTPWRTNRSTQASC